MTEEDQIEREATAIAEQLYDIITSQPFDEAALTASLVALGKTAIMVMGHLNGPMEKSVEMFVEMVRLQGRGRLRRKKGRR